jgi:hypothetical protein
MPDAGKDEAPRRGLKAIADGLQQLLHDADALDEPLVGAKIADSHDCAEQRLALLGQR